jgi:cysteine-rich repeat protein
MAAFEFSGLAAAALDQVKTAVGNGTSPSTGSTAATAVGEELLFGAIGVETESGETFTAGTNYAALAAASSGSQANAASNITVDPEYRIVLAIGSYAADGTLETARRWAAALATYRAAGCGDGVLDAGEGCDDGNQRDGDCCSALCQIEAAGSVCRAAADVCDAAESCDGASPACPADGFVAAGTTCRAAADVCDAAESCDGAGPACPADGFVAAGTTCRAAAGVCDVAEACTGAAAACPADSKSTAVCRPAVGACDVAESCDGAGPACPADGFVAAGTTCRAAAGVCDLAESCTGAAAACPADSKSTAVCRPAAGACDVAESCDGTAAACPADAFVAEGTPCEDGNACTTEDACAAGECVGIGTPTACADATGCYGIQGAPLPVAPVANLVDQLEDVDVDVMRPRELCSPAEVDGVEAFDPITALTSFKVRISKEGPKHVKRSEIAVANDLGEILVDTVRVDHLLVPSTHGSVVPAEVPNSATLTRDHYKCYKIRQSSGYPKFSGATLAVADAFTTGTTLVLKKPKHLCTPVSVDGRPVGNPGASLLCYQARVAKGQPRHARRKNLEVSTGLGETVVSTTRETAVCIPSEIVP